MSYDFKALENRVYEKLDENKGIGLQPDDAQDLLDTLEKDALSERMQKLLEQLARTKPNRIDRMRITTSLLQLFEAHRQEDHVDPGEHGVAEELFGLAKKSRTSNDSGEKLIDKGVEVVQNADEALFDDAEITREDAAQFLRDMRAKTKEVNNPEGVVGDTLRSLGEALK